MKIGITEYGDAGTDFRWENKLENVDGAILITKNINHEFIRKVMEHYKETPLIVHCTCTGWGGSPLEPNVPPYKVQLCHLRELVDSGFPEENVVLRIDPVFPSRNGLKRVLSVIDYFHKLGFDETKIRYKMSIVDEYPHVRKRYEELGFKPLYGGNFFPNNEQIDLVGKVMSTTGLKFTTCAEDRLASKYPDTFKIQGCVSREELNILGIEYDASMFENPQKRSGCHCLSCKTELLSPRKTCPNGCVYCFWKSLGC